MFSALGRPLKYSCGLFEYRVNPRTGSASGRGRYVFRGLPSWAMPRGLQPDPRPVSHVVFVVHGIGEALHTHASTTFPLETLRAAVDEFRGMTASVVDQHREDLNAMYCYARAQALVADDPAGGAPSQPPAGAGGEQGQPESDPYPPPPPKGRIEYVPSTWRRGGEGSGKGRDEVGRGVTFRDWLPHSRRALTPVPPARSRVAPRGPRRSDAQAHPQRRPADGGGRARLCQPRRHRRRALHDAWLPGPHPGHCGKADVRAACASPAYAPCCRRCSRPPAAGTHCTSPSERPTRTCTPPPSASWRTAWARW